MGEHARYGAHEIKIGTCENMYYLRADQAAMVWPLPGNVRPNSPEDQKVIRFRFPWPDEDHLQPGMFEEFERKISLHGITPPAEVEHHNVQFSARAGYLVSLPCPESKAEQPFTIGRNAFQGAVSIVQQAYRNGHLALICQCGGCGAKYNLPTLEDAQPVIDALHKEADREARTDEARAVWYRTIADRILAGYVPAEVVEEPEVEAIG